MDTETKKQKDDSGLTGRILRYAGVLTLVCLLSGAGVSLLYVASAQRIEEQEAKAFEQTLDKVIGDATEPREEVEEILWVADIPEAGVRYVARGTARGYQSDIVVLVSVEAETEETPVSEDTPIYRLAVLSSAETPGLGENINLVERTVSLWEAMIGRREDPGRPWFQTQFSGMNMDDLKLEEDEGEVEAITGATETSEAAAEAARKALRTIIDQTGELYNN